MPFDLDRAAQAVRQRHRDAMGFRQTLLDHLFAAGCPVREQAVALEFGDAVCVRTSGPAAPNDLPPLVIVAVDLDPPAIGSHWPEHLQSLGGPAVAVAWLAALRALLALRGQRPWQAILVRGPALGLHDYLASLREELPSTAELVQLVPGATIGGGLPNLASHAADLDMARLELVRPRNIWRLPACDHSYVLEADVPFGEALPRLRKLLRDTPGMNWTLHGLQVGGGKLNAVLRTSQALAGQDGLTLREVHGEQRLMFPVNDALTALQQIAPHLPHGLGEPLQSPPWAEGLPDGLLVHALVPPVPEDADLPDRSGTMTLQWRVEPVARTVQNEVRLAVAENEAVGPAPVGLTDRQVWRLPVLETDENLGGLVRALQTRLAGM